jgi:hypothetical protein
LLAPATILGTPAEAGLNQKNSTSSLLRRDSGLKQLLIFTRQRPLAGESAFGFNALPQQVSLSQNAQWRSQNLFKPSMVCSKLFWYTSPGITLIPFNVLTDT